MSVENYAEGEVLKESITPNFETGQAEKVTVVARHTVETVDLKPGEIFLNPADRKRYVWTGPTEGWLKLHNDRWGF